MSEQRLDIPAGPFVPLQRLPMSSVRREPLLSLDGEWEFQLLERPDTVLGEWGITQVPGLWTMDPEHLAQDGPHYTNVVMPFDQVPPEVPEHNPTGVYRRRVSLTPRNGHRLVLHVGAAESALHVFVNGMRVGSSTDSHLAAEFDITAAVVDGVNEIMLAVVKWNAETYLEDQDQWWHGGIARSVGIIEVPEVRIADAAVVADLDPANGLGSLDVKVFTEGLAHLTEIDWTVEIDALGHVAVEQVAPRRATQTLPGGGADRSKRPEHVFPPDMMDIISLPAAGAPIPPGAEQIVQHFAQTVLHNVPAGEAHHERTDLVVDGWNAESPRLYPLVLRLRDGEGVIRDEVTYRVGFRRVEIVGKDLLVNGARVLIQGVNRHDSDPRTGRVMSVAGMRAELELMKRSHINAIRTAHYPNDPALLDLADELGFYVVDEADVEGHAFAGTIANDPRYLTRMMERYSRMVIRDRNHPSVIIWSLGNETGYGVAHDTMAAWSRAADPTRPVHYEGAIQRGWYTGHAATDIVCPMYAAPAALEAYAANPKADRPLILCEYAYSQGNSTGGLAEYWQRIETLPGLQGGFVWEWRDHCLDPDGSGRYRYGGDFGDRPNDGAVLANGLVFADLTPKPALFELRGVFSPARVVSDSDDVLASGRITLRNRQFFRPLSDYVAQVRVETTTGPVAATVVPLPDVAPGQQGDLVLPEQVADAARRPDALAVTVQLVTTSEHASWAAPGTELAGVQVTLPYQPAPIEHDAVGAEGIATDGSITHPLLAAAPELCLWRALTENESSFSLVGRFVNSGFHQLTLTGTEVQQGASAVVVRKQYATAWGDPVTHERTITPVGQDDYVLHERVTLPAGQADGLRVGMEYTLAAGFDQAQYVGFGPWENYPDRAAAALLGRWESSIDALGTPYVVPQENGTRTGTWSTVLTGPAGTVETRHAVPLTFSAGRNTIAELEATSHHWQLPARETTTVHLDVATRGVGTAFLGPDAPRATRPAADSYEWTWRLNLRSADR